MPRTTDTRRLNLKLFEAQIQIPLPNKYLGFGYKELVFCRNNGWIMENMVKELTVPKWVLIVRPKYPKCLKNFQPKMSAQAQKFEIFENKLSLGVRSPSLAWFVAIFHPFWCNLFLTVITVIYWEINLPLHSPICEEWGEKKIDCVIRYDTNVRILNCKTVIKHQKI